MVANIQNRIVNLDKYTEIFMVLCSMFSPCSVTSRNKSRQFFFIFETKYTLKSEEKSYRILEIGGYYMSFKLFPGA